MKASGWLQSTVTTTDGLVTECHHCNACHTLRRVLIIECYIACFLYTMCAFEVRASSHPLGYLCAKFCFCRGPQAELACGEKSHIQSITHSLSHPAYLMPREPKLSLWNSYADKAKYNETTRPALNAYYAIRPGTNLAYSTLPRACVG